VEIDCDVPSLNWPTHHALGTFATSELPDGFSRLVGSVQPYDESVVTRHLSPDATPVKTGDDLIELYEHGERFWLVDDRWGLCEVNFRKSQWQSWVLDHPRLQGVQLAEAAVLWPLAQLMQHKSLTLIPAVSIARRGFGALIICPFGIEPELSALLSAGWRVIGQRWTALRDDDGRVAMLSMPGAVERSAGSSRRLDITERADGWIDLLTEAPEARQHHEFCDAVIIVDAARRSAARVRPINTAATAPSLRRAWPVFELRSPQRATNMPARMAMECSVYDAQLSRRAEEFVMAMDRVSATRVPRPAPVQMQIMPERRQKQIPA